MELERKYWNITNWIANGHIELGQSDYHSDATARVVDDGGVIWETDEVYPTLDALLDAVDAGIAAWCEENGIDWDE
ncbi:MAG: hypothetical protein AAF639_46210 [Chloroflexota bacterium]